MKKKALVKAVAAAAAITQIITCTAFAAVTKGTTENGYYYWQEDFNDYTNTTPSTTAGPTGVRLSSAWKTAKGTMNSTTVADGNYALQAYFPGTTSTNGYFYINAGETTADLFSKGDVVVSYDVSFNNDNPMFRAEIDSSSGNIMAHAIKFDGQRRPQGGDNKPSQVDAAVKGKNYRVDVAMHKTETGIQIEQYINGVRLVPYAGGEYNYSTAPSDEALAQPMIHSFQAGLITGIIR